MFISKVTERSLNVNDQFNQFLAAFPLIVLSNFLLPLFYYLNKNTYFFKPFRKLKHVSERPTIFLIAFIKMNTNTQY